jgi:hypothetical protein
VATKKLDTESLLNQPIEFSRQQPTKPPNAVDADDIPEMLDLVLRVGNQPSFQAMIESYAEQYESRGWLTSRQYDVLEDAFIRAMQKGA